MSKIAELRALLDAVHAYEAEGVRENYRPYVEASDRLRWAAMDALPDLLRSAEAFEAIERHGIERIELGCAGHFIGGRSCHWHRHTQVGNYRVSSVGDYYPNEKRETLGASADSFFETYVFKTTDALAKGNDGCGCREVAEWCEIDGSRWATAGEAQAGHESFVSRYLATAVLEASAKVKGGK